MCKYNLDAAVRAIKKNNKFTIRLSDNEMKLFAHALFNLGILAEKTVVLVALLNMLTRRIFDRKIQKALVLQRFASELSQRG